MKRHRTETSLDFLIGLEHNTTKLNRIQSFTAILGSGQPVKLNIIYHQILIGMIKKDLMIFHTFEEEMFGNTRPIVTYISVIVSD